MIARLQSPPPVIEYPEEDGEPIAENTKQYNWIVTIEGGFQNLFEDVADVFVAADLFWYPVEGNNRLRRAADVMIVFGRPKGDRRSYLQWQEDNIAPQVVWEILSPSNRRGSELRKKFLFYQDYGVEEYYIYDPDYGKLNGWLRSNGELREIANMQGWKSPRTGVSLRLQDKDLVLVGPDGEPFRTRKETVAQLKQRERERLEAQETAEAARLLAQAERQRAEAQGQRAEQERQRAEAERQRAEAQEQRAEQERQRAEAERQRAEAQEQRAEQERQQTEAERQRADRQQQLVEALQAQLRALGLDPQQTSSE